MTGLNGWKTGNFETVRMLSNDGLNLLAVINTDPERIKRCGHSQFLFSTSDRIYNELLQESLEADLGWSNVNWGMNLQQIIEAYPKAELLAEPNVYTHNNQKFAAPLTIRKFPLLNQFYEMDFVIDSANHLTGVIFGLKNNNSLEAEFSDLANFLMQKYGSPETSRNGNSLQWKQSGTEITLNYVSVSFSNTYFIKLICWHS